MEISDLNKLPESSERKDSKLLNWDEEHQVSVPTDVSTPSDTEKMSPIASRNNNAHTWKNNSSVIFKHSNVNDNFKADYLLQLTTNALPPYVPPSPPPFIIGDCKTFELQCCTDCGDSFIFKSSLLSHLERRSVLIRFPCDTCCTLKVFYNRCNLLSHIRSHTDKGEKADISKAVVYVLPRVFMDGIQSEFVNTLDEELNTLDDGDATPASELLEFSLHEEETPLDESILNINANTATKIKCLDCNEEFDDPEDRKNHLTNGNRIPVNVPQCSKCEILCPSKCSLKAHQRIHLQISPYVCPECGESPDPHWNNFLSHVNYKCFHSSRRIGYKCPVCRMVSLDNEDLLKHTQEHSEKYYKCNVCPHAFMNLNSYKQHSISVHKTENCSYTVIFKCCLCDIVVLSSEQMTSHRSMHLKEQVGQYVFSCLHCNKLTENKDQLSEHIRVSHLKIYKKQILTQTAVSKTSSTSMSFYKGTVECLLCYSTFQNLQCYSVHLARSHTDPNKKCYCCYNIITNRRQMVHHGKMHLKSNTAVCLLCKNKVFSSAEDLGSHLESHVKKLKFHSYCPMCDHGFSNISNALNHLRKEHYLSSVLEVHKTSNQRDLADTEEEFRCHFCRELFGNKSELQNHLKKEHKISGDTPEKRPAPESEEIPTKKVHGGNTCGKCEFNSISRAEFKKHILTHKVDKSSYQCQECGLCYVVQPSLAKHLIISHRILDPDKYISEEGTNFVPEFENPSETSTRSALECSVCFTSFQNETALKTHLRSHGMAFIQANKSGLL